MSLAQMSPTASALQEQMQLTLAVGDVGTLQQLLTDCWPPLARPGELGAVQAEVAVVVHAAEPCLDGVMRFEQVLCALGGSQPDLPSEPTIASHDHYQALTSCVSTLHTLAKNQPLSHVIALLSQVGFAGADIDQILHLPYQAWHKSWWYQGDEEGQLAVPFQRFIRTRRFGDGTFTLQYKDYYAQEPPRAFHGHQVVLPVVIERPLEGFTGTLERINRGRRALEVMQALLIAHELPSLAAEGFRRQGVSVYTAEAAMADCSCCQQLSCPLQGQPSSPVLACRDFAAGARSSPAS